MAEILNHLEMRVVTCECGLTWAAPEAWFKHRQRDHKTFYCPNGCPRWFPSEPDPDLI